MCRETRLKDEKPLLLVKKKPSAKGSKALRQEQIANDSSASTASAKKAATKKRKLSVTSSSSSQNSNPPANTDDTSNDALSLKQETQLDSAAPTTSATKKPKTPKVKKKKFKASGSDTPGQLETLAEQATTLKTKAETKIIKKSQSQDNSDNDTTLQNNNNDNESTQPDPLLTKLGLVDSMSKFFTPANRHRHHDAFFAFIQTNNGNKQATAESNVSSHKLLMAKKLLKRTKTMSKQMKRASSMPSREFRSFDEGGPGLLNLSDKENQQNQMRFKNLSMSLSPTVITLHSPKNTISPKKSPVLLSSKLKKQAALMSNNKKTAIILQSDKATKKTTKSPSKNFTTKFPFIFYKIVCL